MGAYLIPLHGTPAPTQNPWQAAQAGQASALTAQAMQQHRQLTSEQIQAADMANRQAQIQMQSQADLNDSIKENMKPSPDGGVAIDYNGVATSLGQKGRGSAAQGYLSGAYKVKKEAADAIKDELANHEAQINQNVQTFQGANDDPSYQQVLPKIQENLKLAGLDPSAAPEHYDPDFMKRMTLMGTKQADAAKQAHEAADLSARIHDNAPKTSAEWEKQFNSDIANAKNDKEYQYKLNKWKALSGVQQDPTLKTLLAQAPPTWSPDFQDQAKLELVPVEKQPEYQIKKTQADAMADLDPAKIDGLVDSAIPPTSVTIGGKPFDTSELNKRVKAQVQGALKLGLGMPAIQAAIKDAADQIGRTETGVRTAEATAPIKISVAAANQQAGSNAAGLTDDDFRRAGEQYAITGVMPAMGFGSFNRGKIVHFANEFARESGLSPRDLAAAQASFAGDKDSLKSFQKQRDQIVSFEQTAQKNLDLFLGAAEKIPDTGVPWLNLPLRAVDEKMAGSANMAAVNAARQVANNEIAKVTSGGGMGGVLSDSARHEVESYNPKNATFKQTLAVAKVLKQDMANRHQSMDATLSEIKSRIGGMGQGGDKGNEQAPRTGGNGGGPQKGEKRSYQGHDYLFDGAQWVRQ